MGGATEATPHVQSLPDVLRLNRPLVARSAPVHEKSTGSVSDTVAQDPSWSAIANRNVSLHRNPSSTRFVLPPLFVRMRMTPLAPRSP